VSGSGEGQGYLNLFPGFEIERVYIFFRGKGLHMLEVPIYIKKH